MCFVRATISHSKSPTRTRFSPHLSSFPDGHPTPIGLSRHFRNTVGLPPPRTNDHSITLHPETSTISIRPYKYPHIQKTNIEQLAMGMLQAGLIQPITSPYSNPVLLVRKIDGRWRFCIDHRALNKATMADKFPIPIIE